jgi:hypothetical protein
MAPVRAACQAGDQASCVDYQDFLASRRQRQAIAAQHLNRGAARSSYTISRPGELPTVVRPTAGGGYTISEPGERPTFARPNGIGGYTVSTPGEPPTFIQPHPGFGE